MDSYDQSDDEEVEMEDVPMVLVKRPQIADLSGPGWSPVELLPSELMWSIIDMCPKLMYPMRLTSKPIDARVREYAVLKAEVAENVAFVSAYEPISNSEMEKVLRLEITFSPMKKRWFNLRYYLLPDHLTEGFKQYGAVRFTFREQCAPAEYEVVHALLGERAEEIELRDCNATGELDIVSKVIEKMEFRKMKLRSEKLSQNAADHLLKTIIEHKVSYT